MTQEISRNDYFKLISETGRIPKDDEYEIIPLDLSEYPLNEDTVRIADKNFTEDKLSDIEKHNVKLILEEEKSR